MSINFKKYIRHEFSAKGRVLLKDGRVYLANFQIYLLSSGNLTGSLWFREDNGRLDDVVNIDETFALEGEGEEGLIISAEQCAFHSYTPLHINNFSVRLLTAGFTVNILKVYDPKRIGKTDEVGTKLFFEIGISNFYSMTNFSINTEIGKFRCINYLESDEIAIFKRSFIPFIASCLKLEVEVENSFEAIKQKVFHVVWKILELTGFVLTCEHRWSYYKVFLTEASKSQFVYYESINRLPMLPNSHNNIDESRIEDFLTKAYNNYSDQLNLKYNFSLALRWYLDSVSLKYDVIKYVSATTSLESILDAFSTWNPSTENEVTLPKKDFKELRKKIEATILDEIGAKFGLKDIKYLLDRLPDINRRSYRRKAERLLDSLAILDETTKESLKDIIEIRDNITHTGRFVSKDLDEKKVAKTYNELFNLLTKIFLKILVPDDITFYQQYLKKTWKELQ